MLQATLGGALGPLVLLVVVLALRLCLVLVLPAVLVYALAALVIDWRVARSVPRA